MIKGFEFDWESLGPIVPMEFLKQVTVHWANIYQVIRAWYDHAQTHAIISFFLIVILLPLMLNVSSWLLWILISIIVGISRIIYSMTVVFHVMVDVFALSFLKTGYTIYRYFIRMFWYRARSSNRQKLNRVKSLEEYQKLAVKVDEEEGSLEWRGTDADFQNADLLRITISKLDDALKSRDVNRLQFSLLNGLLKRNHLGIDERVLHLTALSGTKYIIEKYNNKVRECLEYLCNCDELSREDKMHFFKKARRALGQTALLLSGGGSIAMRHMGVIRSLISKNLYRYIRVVSGASGGSIIAGLLAFMTEKELMEKVLIPEVVADFKFTGEMKRRNIRWFPPLLDQMKHFIKYGVLVDNREFQRTCKFYYGDWTFQEGFERTRKHVCISVSPSTLGVNNPGGPKRLLLNHITTPSVLIRSAVAASCSLPGIMKPNHLLCKDERGNICPFEIDGVQYVDGSLQADLPFRRISTLFSASNFIVSQVNPHVVPFLQNSAAPSETSWYWRACRFFDLDIRHRGISLAELGLLPRIFGQDITGVFRQRYHGDVTIVPTFSASEMVGFKAVVNPSVAEMQEYIMNGQRSTWEVMHCIEHQTFIERVLTDCIAKLRRQNYLAQIQQQQQQQQQMHGSSSQNNLSLSLSHGKPGLPTPRTVVPSPQTASTPTSSRPPSRSSSPGPHHLTKADSQGRFDDDNDILESSESSLNLVAAAAAVTATTNTSSNRSPGGKGPSTTTTTTKGGGATITLMLDQYLELTRRVKDLEGQNCYLCDESQYLAKTLKEVLQKIEKGLFNQHESFLSSDSDEEASLLSRLQVCSLRLNDMESSLLNSSMGSTDSPESPIS